MAVGRLIIISASERVVAAAKAYSLKNKIIQTYIPYSERSSSPGSAVTLAFSGINFSSGVYQVENPFIFGVRGVHLDGYFSVRQSRDFISGIVIGDGAVIIPFRRPLVDSVQDVYMVFLGGLSDIMSDGIERRAIRVRVSIGITSERSEASEEIFERVVAVLVR